MAELVPTPFAQLLRRVMLEPGVQGTMFDLPRNRWFAAGGDAAAPALDPCRTRVRFLGRPARTPIGPAAGPQDQMAQNLVLSFLGGSRIFELKTIQLNDRLTIGRPCIEAATVGWNIEWSQELRLQQSLEEYVKGAMLVHILQREGICGGPPESDPVIWDMSIGYDLAGIQAEPVRAFVRGFMEASELVEKFRAEIPAEFKHLRDLDYPTQLVSSATLSTFHGCPPDEIEKIVDHLIREYGLSTVIKMNPTMLGSEALLHLLHDVLGYTDIEPRASAFTSGLQFDESIEMCRRLQTTARVHGVGLGAKFTNTLETVNKTKYLPDEIMYMSGRPLHVISMELMARFREAYREPIEVTFSAGLEKENVAATLATGCAPATTCTDLLKPGGFGRLYLYMTEYEKALEEKSVDSLAAWIYAAYEQGGTGIKRALAEPTLRDVGEAARARVAGALAADSPARAFGVSWEAVKDTVNPANDFDRLMVWAKHFMQVQNNRVYADALRDDTRYGLERNNRLPKKIDSHLTTFDCIACDKCIPVCPNDANYVYFTGIEEAFDAQILVVHARGDWTLKPGRVFAVDKEHQIANFADWCNECGNCDSFCPEYDGPYIKKPSFFGTRAAWEADDKHDGFHVWRTPDSDHIVGRMEGRSLELARHVDGTYVYNDGKLKIVLDKEARPAGLRLTSWAPTFEEGYEVDLWYFHCLRKLLEGTLSTQRLTSANAAYWPELLAARG